MALTTNNKMKQETRILSYLVAIYRLFLSYKEFIYYAYITFSPKIISDVLLSLSNPFKIYVYKLVCIHRDIIVSESHFYKIYDIC